MELNIQATTVPTTFNVMCTECDFTGSAIIEMASNIKQIQAGEAINFTNRNVAIVCPACHAGYIYAQSGNYIRNEKTNVMERVGDYEG